LKRLMQEKILNPLSDMLLRGDLHNGQSVEVIRRGDALDLRALGEKETASFLH
jgi:hypothetical protein